jgi:outer membrane protein assembly factor BamD
MKRNIAHILKEVIIALVMISFWSGCSQFGKGKKPDKSPEELMSEGISKFAEGSYQGAADRFRELKDRYPYSNLAIHAELKLADSLFKKKEFEEAIEAYREFESLHPKNTSIPYVIYQQGICYFLRIETIDRDQTNTIKALHEFERLIRTFADDQYSLKAKDHIEKCLTNLAEHEFYVGRFYFRYGHYEAALKRFSYLLEKYPDHGPREKTLAYIAECEERLAQETSSQ